MEIIKKLVAYQTICLNCNSEFETYDLPDFMYGERLLLTSDGRDFGYINCIEDEVFDEVSNIVDDILINKNSSSENTVFYFNSVFGNACDMINGKPIDALNSKRSCFTCYSNNINSWEFNPPKIIEKKIKQITHSEWNKLNSAERIEIIRNKLGLLG